MTREEKIMSRLREHYKYLETQGYEIVGLFLQGSQNYNLDEYTDEYMSDIDSKAIVLPTFDDFVKCKAPVSTTIVLDNNEHIDVKDIRIMFDMFKKENISYIELLFTQFRIININYLNIFFPILQNRKIIATANVNQFIRCIAGMSMEKKKALCHPYPNLIDKIEKYGFDGKQLCHAARLNIFLEKFLNGEDIEKCYDATEERDMLMNFKKQLTADGSRIMTKEEAVDAMEKWDASTAAMKDKAIQEEKEINQIAYQILDDIKCDILRYWFKKELK